MLTKDCRSLTRWTSPKLPGALPASWLGGNGRRSGQGGGDSWQGSSRSSDGGSDRAGSCRSDKVENRWALHPDDVLGRNLRGRKMKWNGKKIFQLQ